MHDGTFQRSRRITPLRTRTSPGRAPMRARTNSHGTTSMERAPGQTEEEYLEFVERGGTLFRPQRFWD